MLADVQARFGLARPFHRVGNYETEHQRVLVREVCAVVQTGRLVVVAGLVGSGKTHLLTRIEEELARSNRIAVAKSLAVDKRRTSLPSLIEAMFYDLTLGDRSQVKIPKQPERRERELRDLMRKNKRPVVLIVDEAHELHHKTLTGFKRLMELAAGAGVILSVLLIGHPKLRNDLRRPQMEEIGYRTTTFEFEGVSDYRREFIGWLLKSWASGDDAASTGRTHARNRSARQNSHRSSCIRGAVHTNAKSEHLANYGRSCGIAGAGSAAQCIVQRSLSHFEPGCGFSHSQSFGDDGAGPRELFAGDDGLTPAFPTTRDGRGKARAGALPYQVALELTQCTEQVEDQASTGCRCVDRFGDGAEPDPACRQRGHRSIRCGSERPRPSSFQTIITSPSRTYSSADRNPARSARAPDAQSSNTLAHPAATRASSCSVGS